MVTTSTQTNAPWLKAQPYITYGMQQAQNLQKAGTGFNAPNFQTWSPYGAETKASLAGIQGIANQGNPLAGQSMGAISGILSGDINNKYNQLFSQAGNPYFEQAVQGQSDKIANDVQRQFGGMGRIGSAADTGALTQQIGDFRSQALSNQWNQNIANQRGILGDQGQMQLGAVAAAPGAYQQQYLPAERMAQVGAAWDDQKQRALQSRIDKYNTNQQAPLNRLQFYNQQIGATGGNSPGFAQQKVAAPINWPGIISGGVLAGASVANSAGIDWSSLFPK
jgi:hypothetical protein